MVNLWFQIRTGGEIERGIGSIRMAILYLLSGVGGNLASAIFLPNLISVGASGALFGVSEISFEFQLKIEHEGSGIVGAVSCEELVSYRWTLLQSHHTNDQHIDQFSNWTAAHG